ncbi:feline leukemia virus subgroup C receptor-related protein 2 isoform X1 [Nilaparvata lugens]|uniref:feline leukemia virus subgroup C receptor-related protein 2 isoform X1 n=2 Tax=Nilaparvata lugens TaxID=108931 RepID=UPI00193E5269|nr:feline leukemia virus subgroup C receptor-related protein 2 isoform X1 [Nilaparvata lugens]
MSADYAGLPGHKEAIVEQSAAVPTHQEVECRVYGRRWLMLGLFVFYSMSNAMQWIQYAIIANVVMKYYDVESTLVDWTSIIYMVSYIPLIFPGSWLLDKWGMRTAVIIGATGTCLGSWIKVFSASPDRFAVAFAGQSVVAVSQVFILSVPARLAAVWFGPDQVSSACSIGVFGNQLGVAIGFVFPPMLVGNHDDLSLIGADLKVMYYIVAGITSALLVLVLLLFQGSPPLPPSPAQAVQRNSEENSNFADSIKRLILNPGYILLLTSYGINVGVFYAISTLLNQVVLTHFPGQELDAGRIGLFIVIAGMMGSVISGMVLDKTHKFKEVTLSVYAFSLVGMVIYTFTLGCGHIVVVYITAGILGFFMTGYLPVGFELAAELTYPEPEGTSAGLLNAAAQVFGIIFTMFYGWLFKLAGDIWANVTLSVTLLVGTMLTAAIKSDLRRQAAHSKSNQPKSSPLKI